MPSRQCECKLQPQPKIAYIIHQTSYVIPNAQSETEANSITKILQLIVSMSRKWAFIAFNLCNNSNQWIRIYQVIDWIQSVMSCIWAVEKANVNGRHKTKELNYLINAKSCAETRLKKREMIGGWRSVGGMKGPIETVTMVDVCQIVSVAFRIQLELEWIMCSANLQLIGIIESISTGLSKFVRFSRCKSQLIDGTINFETTISIGPITLDKTCPETKLMINTSRWTRTFLDNLMTRLR